MSDQNEEPIGYLRESEFDFNDLDCESDKPYLQDHHSVGRSSQRREKILSKGSKLIDQVSNWLNDDNDETSEPPAVEQSPAGETPRPVYTDPHSSLIDPTIHTTTDTNIANMSTTSDEDSPEPVPQNTNSPLLNTNVLTSPAPLRRPMTDMYVNRTSAVPGQTKPQPTTVRAEDLHEVEFPRIIFTRFGSTISDSQGRTLPRNATNLLSNIDGFPIELHEANTVYALKGILSTYFAETLKYFGLNLHCISGFGAQIYEEHDGGRIRGYKRHGPVTTQDAWQRVFREISNHSTSSGHCLGEAKCGLCQHPPIVVIYFDQSALENALLSKTLRPDVPLEFLDGSSEVLQLKIDRSNAVLKATYHKLQNDARNGQIVESLVNPVPTAHRYDLGPASPYQIELFTQDTYIGKVPIPQKVAQKFSGAAPPVRIPTIGYVLPPSYSIYTAPVRASSNGQISAGRTMTRTSSSMSSVLGKRPADPNTPNSRPPTRRRLSWGDRTPPPRPQDKIPDSKWDEASEKPQGNQKAEDDTCLTCIYYKRACKGTYINGQGKCENCAPGPNKTSRKCYWADPARNIRTYDDAREQDSTSYRVQGNTRDGRKARKHRQEEVDARLQGNGLSPSIQQDFATHLPTIQTGLLQNNNYVSPFGWNTSLGGNIGQSGLAASYGFVPAVNFGVGIFGHSTTSRTQTQHNEPNVSPVSDNSDIKNNDLTSDSDSGEPVHDNDDTKTDNNANNTAEADAEVDAVVVADRDKENTAEPEDFADKV